MKLNYVGLPAGRRQSRRLRSSFLRLSSCATSLRKDRRIVSRAGEELHLTRKEYDVLAVLAKHVGRVVTHERIIASAWGGDEDPRVEYLRIVIRNLRQKIEAPGPIGSVIANELGVGYRLKAD